jgi:hypothetical protein
MCGRLKEICTLQLFNECMEGKEFHFDWKTKCNVFVVSADAGKFTLYKNDFKNVQSHGPSKFEIDDSMWLVPYVKEYIRKRTDLLCGNYTWAICLREKCTFVQVQQRYVMPW